MTTATQTARPEGFVARYLRTRRTRQETTMPETTVTTETTATPTVLMQFRTQGGAVVELRAHRFRTNYTWKGRPYVGDEYYDVDGYNWRCLGCDKQGNARAYSTLSEPYLPMEDDKARDDANKHAATCRAMPKPEAS